MVSMQQIRTDLREIRYYYARRKLFDDASENVVASAVLEKVRRYNAIVAAAPAKLYDLYISVYTQNNSLYSLTYEWNLCYDYIKALNKELCEFLYSELNGRD